MDIEELLRVMVYSNASDMHLKEGGPPVLRINGDLITNKQIPAMTSEDMRQCFESMSTEEQKVAFAEDWELDFAYAGKDTGRFRVSAYAQGGSCGLVLRLVQTAIPTVDSLGLPEMCKALAMKPHGLVVVTGPTGSGKSTTLAAMVNYINENESRKIVTIEDPIEFIHQDNKCVFSQREVGADTKSFANALKCALRQDLDVILVGEMRDLDTTAAVLTAAETGHLVLTTLHTPSAAQAVDRIIDIFPSHQQQQVRTQLSIALEGVIYQTLVPTSDSSRRVVAAEVMIATTAIRNLIREGKTFQLSNAIQTGTQYGMQSLDQSLLDLYRKGIINDDQALTRCNNQPEFKSLLGRIRR